MVIADTSGSMFIGNARPGLSAVALAIYFAEHNTGPYHNLWMSFSGKSDIQRLKGETLAQKLRNLDISAWGGSTNLEGALEKILKIAKDYHVSQDEMVKSLIIISDMEIDYCTCSNENYRSDWSFYGEMKYRYQIAGYKIPNIVFWNVNSRHDVFHVDKDREGVQLCSGQATSTFKAVIDSINLTPMQMMYKVLCDERYTCVEIDE